MPVDGANMVVMAQSNPTRIIRYRAGLVLGASQIYGVRVVRRRSLLSIVRFPIISVSYVRTNVWTTRNLVTLSSSIVSGSVKATRMIFDSNVISEQVQVVIRVRTNFTFCPANVITVRADYRDRASGLSPTFSSIGSYMNAALLGQILLTVNNVRVADLHQGLLVDSNSGVVRVFVLIAAIFRHSPDSLVRQRLGVTIVTTAEDCRRRNEVRRQVFTVPIRRVFVVNASRRYERQDFREQVFLVVPVRASSGVIPSVSNGPRVLSRAQSYDVCRDCNFPYEGHRNQAGLNTIATPKAAYTCAN